MSLDVIDDWSPGMIGPSQTRNSWEANSMLEADSKLSGGWLAVALSGDVVALGPSFQLLRGFRKSNASQLRRRLTRALPAHAVRVPVATMRAARRPWPGARLAMTPSPPDPHALTHRICGCTRFAVARRLHQ